MLQRMSLRDGLFVVLALFGVAIAAYHIANDSALTGGLVLGGLLLGAIVRFTVGDATGAVVNGAQEDLSDSSSRALDRGGRWREDQTRSDVWLRAGIIAGFSATIVMSVALVVGYLGASIFADQNASTVSGWFYGLTHNSLTDDTFEIPIGAYGLNLIAGIIWALIYASFFEPRLRGPGWWRGMSFSLLPWLLSLVVFFPLVGGGFLGFDLEAGPLPIIGNLILHLVYGASLGWLYVALTSTEVDIAQDPLLQASWIDHGIALGLAGGLTLGLIAGAFAGLLIDLEGTSSVELTLGGAAVGIIGGLLIGPLASLEAGSSQNVPHIG